MSQSEKTRTSRRRFLHHSASTAIGGSLASQLAFPAVVSGAPRSDTLQVGLIGCGGRGTGAALDALQADDNVHLTAMGDLFEDQLESSLKELNARMPEKINVPADRQFLGFDAFQRVTDSDVDVVLLTTPPGFRPQHLRAAIEGGKHAFVEITPAIDAPGVRSVLESADLARKENLALVSGFCWRSDPALRAMAASA